MARGINMWGGAGNVGGDILFGETNGGDLVCNYLLFAEDRMGKVTRVRCNVYGPLVEICRKRLKRGCYVAIEGSLMNRSDGSEAIEVRCETIVFVPGGRHERKEEEPREDGECG